MSDQMPTARRYHWLSASWMNRPRPSVPTLVPRHRIWSQPSTGRSACHTLELQDVDSRCLHPALVSEVIYGTPASTRDGAGQGRSQR